MSANVKTILLLLVLVLWGGSIYVSVKWGISAGRETALNDTRASLDARRTVALCEDALKRRTSYESVFMKGEFLKTQEMVVWLDQRAQEAKDDIKNHCS
ncbi:MAG: hypothetical protein VX966_01375 [Chloroflexota bacterium]|nr:hypothetical protein [Chloroflexota bacterium]